MSLNELISRKTMCHKEATYVKKKKEERKQVNGKTEMCETAQRS